MNQIKHKDGSINKIAIPTAEGFEMVPFEQVIRCEADDNYTHLYLKNNTKIVACRTLKEMEEQLKPFNNRQVIVQSWYVAAFSRELLPGRAISRDLLGRRIALYR